MCIYVISYPFPVYWWCSTCDGRCWPEASGPWLCYWASAPRCWDGPNTMAGPCAAGAKGSTGQVVG